MDVVGDGLDMGGPAAPVPDVTSMSRAMGRVCDALGIERGRMGAAMAARVPGGVMPDVSLARLENLAAAAGARVRVVIEAADGRDLDLTDLV